MCACCACCKAQTVTHLTVKHAPGIACCRVRQRAGMDDINDVQNGLLLARPIAWAFKTGRLSFLNEQWFDEWQGVLLDPRLKDVTLTSKMTELWSSKPGDAEEAAVSVVLLGVRKLFRLFADVGWRACSQQWYHALLRPFLVLDD